MDQLKQPLSNVQLEILKTFSYQLSEEELLELREVIAGYFANKAIQAANQVWEEKGWTDQEVEKMLHTKMPKSKP